MKKAIVLALGLGLVFGGEHFKPGAGFGDLAFFGG